MIKGCQKKIIFVEGGENSPFETAYFVLRKDSEDCCIGGDDILREADRIIAESLPDVRRSHKRREKLKRRVVSGVLFLSGLLGGGVATALIILIIG